MDKIHTKTFLPVMLFNAKLSWGSFSLTVKEGSSVPGVACAAARRDVTPEWAAWAACWAALVKKEVMAGQVD